MHYVIFSFKWQLVMEYCLGSASDIIEVHKEPLHEGATRLSLGIDGADKGVCGL